MDRNFARALALVLKSEGGWSDNPKDPGGPTMTGVTLANFRRYVKADATKADLKKITDAQIATVYRRFYWDAVAGAELPDGVDYAVFDFAVNSGPGRAAKYLQAVAGVAQDGRIGPATLAAVEAKPAGVIIDGVCDDRLAFLKKLPTWGEFGKGWSDRVKSVRANALKMTAQSAGASPVTPTAPDPAPVDLAAAVPAVAKDTIARVQQQLKDLGYTEVGGVDGKTGTMTATAIRAFRAENGLPPGDGIDDDLLLALQKAKPRVLAPARTDATPEVVRDKVPEVRTNWLTKVGAFFTGLVALVGSFFDGILGNLGAASGYIQPVKDAAGDLPGWVWMLAIAVVAGGLYLVARHGEAKGVEAFQTGARR